MDNTPGPQASRTDKWKAKFLKFHQKNPIDASTSQTRVPISAPSRSSTPPSNTSANSEEAKELGPIRALWNEAYKELKSKNPDLVTVYEDQLRQSLHGMIASTAIGGVGKGELMKTVVDVNLQQYKDDTWKWKAFGEEFLVKDMAKPVIGVIKWADKYVGEAVKTNPMASIGWAGVMVFVPLLLNPSKQHAALLEGLDAISNVLVRSAMQEDLYSRRWEAKADTNDKNNFLTSHMKYRDTLRSLYVLVLKYQATSIGYFIQSDGFKFVEDMVQWRNWKDLLESVKKQDEAMCRTYNLLNEVKIQEEFEKLDARHTEMVNIFKTGFKDLLALMNAIETAREVENHSGLLAWLCSLDASQNYNNAFEKHQKGTGEWLLNGNYDFESWKEEPNSLIWLNGKAGSGKTILSSSVINHLLDAHKHDPQVTLAYFYFSFKNELKQSTVAMIESIIKQLCCRRPDTPPSLKALEELKLCGHRPNLKTLQNVLKETLCGFASVYIIVDALDECPELDRGREVLLRCLNTIHETNAGNLHMFWTSRRETDIERSFQSISSSAWKCDMDLEGRTCRQKIDHDIGLYIDSNLSLPYYNSWPDDLKAEARKELISQSDGMFQYISCQFDILRNAKTVPEIKEALAHLPKGLDETYNRMLMLIEPTNRKRVANVLTWLAFSLRPLLVEEVAEIFILDMDPEAKVPFDDEKRLLDPRDVLQFLSGFVTTEGVHITKKTSNHYTKRRGYTDEIRLAHFSVKEFLVSNRMPLELMHIFRFEEMNAHLHITKSCMTYHLHLSRTILVTQEIAAKYQLWEYVVHAWPMHLDILTVKIALAVEKQALQCFSSDSQSLSNIVCIRGMPPSFQPRWYYETADETANSLPRPINYACSIGSFRLTQFLIEGSEKAFVNEVSPNNCAGTALHAAVIEGQIEIAQLLLENGAEVNIDVLKYGQPLQAAVMHGGVDMIQLLLDWKADVNGKGGPYGNALQAAIARCYWSAGRILLSNGAELDVPGAEWEEILGRIKKEFRYFPIASRFLKFRENPTLEGLASIEADEDAEDIRVGRKRYLR